MGIFSLIGTLKRNEENLQIIKEISGSSAGAILGLFLALNIHIDKILEMCLELDITSMMNINITTFLTSYGFVDIEPVKNKLIEMCNCNPKFKELSKKLYVSAYCLNTNKTEYFSCDTHPDMYVIDAVCMSMSIPVVFESPGYNGYNYIDGCFYEDYPLQPFLDKKDHEITCIKIKTNRNFKSEINSAVDFFECVILGMVSNRNIYTKKIKFLETKLENINIFNFGMSYEEKVKLYTLGYNTHTTKH